MSNKYSTPNTEHAVNKANEMILEAVRKDMEEFESALREGRLNDAADIALEQQRPDMADRVLRAGEKAKEKAQNIAQKATSEPEPEPAPQPQPSGATIDQIADLLGNKLDPVIENVTQMREVLPTDKQGQLEKVASERFVREQIAILHQQARPLPLRTDPETIEVDEQPTQEQPLAEQIKRANEEYSIWECFKYALIRFALPMLVIAWLFAMLMNHWAPVWSFKAAIPWAGLALVIGVVYYTLFKNRNDASRV